MSWKMLLRRIFQQKTDRGSAANRYLGKPKELFGVGSPDRVSIVYIGNGAKESYYQKIIDRKELDGKAYSGMGGFYNECAVIHVIPNAEGRIEVPVMEAFSHRSERAFFSGFTLRKKENGKWMWYLADGSWNGEWSKKKKKLFYENDVLPKVEKSSNYPVYVLTAQWVDESQRSMNCGYRIFRNKVMAHALGSPGGKDYQNTIEGLEQSIKNGFRFFEADLSLTTDDRVMVCHGWTKKDCKRIGIPYDPAYEHMTYDMARQLRINGNPVIDTKEFYEYIKKLPKDYYFEIDYHNRQPGKHPVFAQRFVRDFNYDEEVLSRLLMQVYSATMFKVLDSCYPFETYQYSLVHGTDLLEKAIQICLEYGICSIAIRSTEISKEVIEKCKFAGLYILAFPVNKNMTFAKTLLENGVDTICTNNITEEQVREHNDIMEQRPYYLGIPKSAVKDLSELDHQFDIAMEENGYVYIEVSNSVPNTCVPDLIDPKSDHDGLFQGWALYRTLEGAKWYCKDEVFRSAARIRMKRDQYQILFSSGDELPVLQVKEHEKLMLIANWTKAIR